MLIAYLRSSRSLITLAFSGVPLQWALFAEILKVGVPGLINVVITNMSVVLLTGIAGRLGRDTAIVALVGTNWGAKQYRRARDIAWTGAAAVATTCATIGLLAALFPETWLGLFSNDENVIRIGTWYLQIVGPIYGCYGLGLALHSAMQGFGSVVLIVLANGVRLLASAAGALIAIYWLDLGAIGLFVAVAMGFCAFAAMAGAIMLRVKVPAATPA